MSDIAELIAKNVLYRCETCSEEMNCHPADEMYVWDGALYCEDCLDESGCSPSMALRVDRALKPDTGETPHRHTFTVPDGHVAVLDSEGRATGETIPAPEDNP